MLTLHILYTYFVKNVKYVIKLTEQIILFSQLVQNKRANADFKVILEKYL